ncbi:MAG TPA: hypothetical protein DD381_13255 [Lentisphaeria bacterium]|nr:MAG: hypothetical protein A2X47_11730 [Lentisphaerae bacterium GWF2_38_69]HBM17289.1 hypothetical protein [Lentisphaeria bacterium]
MKKYITCTLITVIILTLGCCEIFAFPVVDVGTHSLLSAQTTNDIVEGIDRAQEALRAYSQSIKLYENAIDRFNKLQDIYKNDIERNSLINTIKDFKGDPQELIGILANTKRTVRRYDYYSNRYYQNPEDIVTDQNLWKNFERAYGHVDNVTYRFTGDNTKQHYENLQELATSYYDYDTLIKENIAKKQTLQKELERLQDCYDNADTENKRLAYAKGMDVVKQSLNQIQDQEENSYRNLQVLMNREKIYSSVRNYLDDNNYAYQETKNRENSKYLTNEEAYNSLREQEDKALARNDLNLW